MIFHPLASSSHGNVYVVSDGVTRILLECGVSYRRLQKLLDFNVPDLSACLISHEHKDHAGCYMDLIKSGIPVLASEGTAEALDCDLIHILEWQRNGSLKKYKEVSVGTFDVHPFETFHDAAEPIGFLIRSRIDGEKLLFATDTVNLAYRFPGVNIVALEANYDDEILARATRMPDKVRHRIQKSHMEIGRTCTFLKKMDRSLVHTVFLLHLSDACSNSALFQDMAERVCPGIDVIVCPRG